MNFIKRQKLKQLNRLILGSAIQSPTHGTLRVVENELRLEVSGVIKTIIISYRGIMQIENMLPDGYSIKLNKNTIIIRKSNEKKGINGSPRP